MTDFPTGLLFADALDLLRANAMHRPLEVESLALSRCHGRVLAEDLSAPMPLPPFDNSAMDGFAFRHADLTGEATTLRLVGEQFAGIAGNFMLQPRECVRITTGAPIPGNADTVAIKENCRVDAATVVVSGSTQPGANVRRAGEDVLAGDAVLAAGSLLTPARVSLAASLGIASLRVSRTSLCASDFLFAKEKVTKEKRPRQRRPPGLRPGGCVAVGRGSLTAHPCADSERGAIPRAAPAG